jgi:acyl-CoA synthetase (AMP-forming)/AMP-acid ligase II
MSVASEVLARLLADGARPRLTWYGADEERVELSGRVLANWVVKATNLLTEEGDVGPGSRVVLDLPVHWRTPVWALAAWLAGAHVVLPAPPDAETDEEEDLYEPDPFAADEDEELDEDEDDEEEFVPDAGEDEADVVVTSRPADAPGATLVLAIALPALARRVEEAIPAGAVDAAAAILSYGDELGYVEEPGPDDVALSGPQVVGLESAATVPYGDLAQWALHQVPAAHRDEPGARVLCAPADLDQLLGHALATWAAGGSVVLLHEDVPHARLLEIADVERATVRC